MRRVAELNHELLRVIKKYDVKYLLCELPHGSQSAVAALMIGITSGVIQTISDCLGIPLEWYSEADSKKCVLGSSKKVTKDEMISAIDKLYTDVQWTNVGWKDEAVADALAVHQVALQYSSVLKFMSK